MYPREYFDTYWRPEIKDQVFVAMSFKPEFESVWTNIIKAAIQDDVTETKLKAERVDNSQISGSIVIDIMEGVANSRVVLADITPDVVTNGDLKAIRNPNVMYEVGLAHAWRQPEEVILIRQDKGEINFDISNIRVHRYNPQDIAGSRDLICKLITSAMREVDYRKSVKVQMAIELLDHPSIQLIHKYHNTIGFSISNNRDDLPVTAGEYHFALSKLLELKMIKYIHQVEVSRTNYAWTTFGKIVAQKLGYDTRITNPQPAATKTIAMPNKDPSVQWAGLLQIPTP